MTALEQLGAFVAGYTVDERARQSLRLHVADTIGAWIAATATEEGRAIFAFDPSDKTLARRIARHVALARLSEIDDIHLAAMVTPGAVVVPAALAIAASMPKIDEGELAAAVIAGYEAMVRLGVAIDGPTVLYRGIWPTYFAAPFGVAAVAARLHGLDSRRAANALSIALIMAAPGTGHHTASTTVRWFAVGCAAARGLDAALAAEAGFTSDPKAAEGEFLEKIFGMTPNAGLLRDGAGGLALDQTGFKCWCAARQTMAAAQALREIIAGGIVPDSIDRIDVAVLPPHLKMINHGVSPGDRFSWLTSVQYQMAMAALRPAAAFALSPPQGAPDSAIAEFMARIEVTPDDTLRAEGYPRVWPARVTVVAAGVRHQRTVTHIPGDPARPLGQSDLKRKFVGVTEPLLGGRSSDEMFAEAMRALERPDHVVRAVERVAAAALKARAY